LLLFVVRRKYIEREREREGGREGETERDGAGDGRRWRKEVLMQGGDGSEGREGEKEEIMMGL
jgi:hypothetical protein